MHIVRPSIIGAAASGWLESKAGLAGLALLMRLGAMHTVTGDPSTPLDVVPVDVVAGAVLSAAGLTEEATRHGPPPAPRATPLSDPLLVPASSAAAERELQEMGGDAQQPQAQDLNERTFHQTVQLVTQQDVACVHVPLDFAQPIPEPERQPLLRVLLHSDRPVGGAPTLRNVQWAPPASISATSQQAPSHELVAQAAMRAVSERCWVAELPVPDAFVQPPLLAQQAPADAVGDAVYAPLDGDGSGGGGEGVDLDDEEEAAEDDDADAVAAVARLQLAACRPATRTPAPLGMG